MIYGELSGWSEDLRSAVKRTTGYVLNARAADSLHQRYIAALTEGAALPRYVTPAGDAGASAMQKRLAAEADLSAPVVRAWLYALYVGQRAGKIPPEKYDPMGARARRDTRAAVDPSALQKIAAGAKGIVGLGGKIALGVAALAGLGLFFYLRKGR